jgi:hypothetical protein
MAISGVPSTATTSLRPDAQTLSSQLLQQQLRAASTANQTPPPANNNSNPATTPTGTPRTGGPTGGQLNIIA